jgi:hypothetical protein
VKINKRIFVIITISVLLVLFLTMKIFRPGMEYERLSLLDNLNKAQLLNGKIEMSKHKVVICGISRDNAKELPQVMKYIEYTGQYFKDYRVIIFENDSKDMTKNILKHWQAVNKRVNILSKDYHNPKKDYSNLENPNISFLAKLRNHYLEELSSNSEYKDFDVVMVVDMDMSYGWDMRGLFHSFNRFSDWAAVCSNGIYPETSPKAGCMRDALAYRTDEEQDIPAGNPEKYWNEITPKLQREHPLHEGFVPVQSCFGGLAFYKRSFIEGCFYDSIKEDCEHIKLHECIVKNKGGRMFMNTGQVIRYSPESP